MNSTNLPPDWCSLPEHLLAMITKFLHENIDTLRLRAVCTSFRNSFPLLQPSTLDIPDPFDPNSQLLLTHFTIYAIQPLHPSNSETWFVKLRELGSGKVRVEDIFYRFTSKKFSQMLPKSFNLLDYRVKEITKGYGFKFVDFNEIHEYPIFKKVVVSSSFIAIMTLFCEGELGVWRKGDEEWTYIDLRGDGIYFEDIVYYNEKFYALGSNGHTITVDSQSLNITQVATPGANADGIRKYLVKSLKDLFFIDKQLLGDNNYADKCDGKSYPIHLNVFKLDEEKHEWIEVVDSLEDTVLFCSSVCSFSVSAKEFSGCKRGCVYFSDCVFSEHNDHPGSNAAIFDLEDNTLGPLSDFPGYSNIFWPPPTWLQQNSKNSDDASILVQNHWWYIRTLKRQIWYVKETDLVRLAFGPETLLQSLIFKAKTHLGFSSNSVSAPTSPSPNTIARFTNNSNNNVNNNPFAKVSPRVREFAKTQLYLTQNRVLFLSFDNIRAGSCLVPSVSLLKNSVVGESGDSTSYSGNDFMEELQFNDYLSFLDESSKNEEFLDHRSQLSFSFYVVVFGDLNGEI